MNAFLKALFLVFISEMGDKTQVVSFSLGAQYSMFKVLTGVLIGITAMMTMTVGMGNIAGKFLPIFWINIASGLLFIAFGLFALRKR